MVLEPTHTILTPRGIASIPRGQGGDLGIPWYRWETHKDSEVEPLRGQGASDALGMLDWEVGMVSTELYSAGDGSEYSNAFSGVADLPITSQHDLFYHTLIGQNPQ